MVRVWKKPITYSVAVARIGSVTTTTVGKTVGATPAGPRDHAVAGRLGVDALRPQRFRRLRQAPDVPRSAPAAVRRGARHPGRRGPAAGRWIAKPWVGIDATARSQPSQTCDRASFVRAGADETRSRTFVIPQAKLPARFGLTETYGRFDSVRQARKFLGEVRSRLAALRGPRPGDDGDQHAHGAPGRPGRLDDLGPAHGDLGEGGRASGSASSGPAAWSRRCPSSPPPRRHHRGALPGPGTARFGDRLHELDS